MSDETKAGADGRRQDDRRQSQQPFDGPDRRKQERRSGTDRRTNPRSTETDPDGT